VLRSAAPLRRAVTALTPAEVGQNPRNANDERRRRTMTIEDKNDDAIDEKDSSSENSAPFLPDPTRLTVNQLQEIPLLLATGCTRSCAAEYAGTSLSNLEKQMRRDDDFARRLLRAEASVEVLHMRNIDQAAKENSDWRSSAWFLEKRFPYRFGNYVRGALREREIRLLGQFLVDIVLEEVSHEADLHRLRERFETLDSDLLSLLETYRAASRKQTSRRL
jgi:hypothetical protein